MNLGRVTSAFDSSDRLNSLKDTVNIVINFPLTPERI
jgi:hypothetical protein